MRPARNRHCCTTEITSGSCTPFSTSPSTVGATTPHASFLILVAFSDKDTSNLLIISIRNIYVSITARRQPIQALGPPKNVNKLAYTPTVTASFSSSLIDVHLSGLNLSASSPHTSGFLLYPAIDPTILVPSGIRISVATATPVLIGFASGTTSSRTATR